VSIKLRTPLLKADIAEHHERWLFLEDGPSSTPATPVQASTSTPKAASTPATAKAAPPQTPAVAPVKASPAKSTAVSDDELEQALAAFDSVDSIASNLVLEKELERLQALLMTNPRQAEDIQDRMQSVQIKLNLLVVQVQTGTLTLDVYINDVRKCIDKTKQYALLFKRANRMDKAREALARVRIMQEEVAEVEQAGLI
jgi:hypothetical protein